jgi:hypothetical protein
MHSECASLGVPCECMKALPPNNKLQRTHGVASER